MRTVPVVCLLVLVLTGFRWSSGAAQGEEQKDTARKPLPDAEAAVKSVITTFYANLGAGKAKENETLFLNKESPISGILRTREAKQWRMKPADYLKQHGVEKKYLQVDSVQVDQVHEELAVARVKYRAGGIKGFGVITLVVEGGHWQIASLFEETHFVW